MVAQAHEADVESLSVVRVPAVDVRVDAVEDRETRERLDTRHEWGPTLVGNHQHVRFEARHTDDVVPSEDGHLLKVGTADIVSVSFECLGEERTTKPEQTGHVTSGFCYSPVPGRGQRMTVSPRMTGPDDGAG